MSKDQPRMGNRTENAQQDLNLNRKRSGPQGRKAGEGTGGNQPLATIGRQSKARGSGPTHHHP